MRTVTDMETPPGAELADDVDPRCLDTSPDEAVNVLLVHLLADQQRFLQRAVHLHVAAGHVTHRHVTALVDPDADVGCAAETALATVSLALTQVIHGGQERFPATLHLTLHVVRVQHTAV